MRRLLRTTRAERGSRGRGRAGITMLEVIMSAVLLGLVGASITGAVSYTAASQARDEIKQDAHELASRLILLYLDDETEIGRLERSGRPLDYGSRRYRFSFSVQKCEMKVKVVDNGRQGPGNLTRFEYVTARVWLDREERGLGVTDEPLAEISRIIDPAYPRNSDAMERFSRDQGRMMDLIRRAGINLDGDRGVAAPGGSSGTRPGGNNGQGAPRPSPPGRGGTGGTRTGGTGERGGRGG